MIRLNTIILTFIIIWCGGWSQFLPLTIRSIISLSLGVIGLLYAIPLWSKKLYKRDIVIILLSMVFPIVSSYTANIIWDQPFYMGLLSLREFFNILFFYYLIKVFKAKDIINTLCKYQLIIMAIDAILLYVFNIDNNRILSLLPIDENTIYVKEAAVENTLRGARLELGTGLTWLTLAYWSAKYYYERSRNNLICILLTLLFVFFVSKSRVSLVVCFLIAVMPLIFSLSFKNIYKIISISLLVIIILLFIPSISQRFLVVFDLLGDTRTTGSGDFSGVARLKEILVAIPYIIRYPIFGVGNISYHFNGGFSGVLNKYFFLADIGIVGMAFMGGIFLCVLYFFIFKNAYTYNLRNQNRIVKLFIKIICGVYLIIPFMGYSPLLSNTILLAFMLYLSYTKTLNISANA